MSICLSCGRRPYTLEQIKATAPAVLSEMSRMNEASYNFISTKMLLERMASEGFLPVGVSQTKCRDIERRNFTKHMIMFRHQTVIEQQDDKEIVPQVVLVNAHDGTSAYKLYCGLFRFVCSNGMIVGSILNKFSVWHKGVNNTLDNVIDTSFKVLSQSEKVLNIVEKWKATTLDSAQRFELAETAHRIKFGDKDTPVRPEQFLKAHNEVDYTKQDSLWNTFNVVQENLIKGGIVAYRNHLTNNTVRKITTRPVNNIHQNLEMNMALWDKAEKIYELAA